LNQDEDCAMILDTTTQPFIKYLCQNLTDQNSKPDDAFFVHGIVGSRNAADVVFTLNIWVT
jgi:hypothetical protein